jgi:PAS domain S-box-containing protein
MNAFMKTEDNVDKIRELREEISRLKEQIRALQLSDEKREKAEEAIRTSGEMLRLVIDNIPQRVFWKDIRSVYLGCNETFARAAGVDDPENIAGKTDFDLAWARSEAEAFRRDDREVMDHDQPKYHIIEPQLQADGRQSWLDTNKVPLHDAQGHVIGILGTYEDITERLKLEERLQLTQFAVDHFTDSSIWLSPEGEILYVNEAACRSLGYTPDELRAMHLWDIDPDYSPENYARIWDELKQKGSITLESRHVARDRRRFPVEVSANYITFREREYLITFDRDITGRKQAEQQLGEAKSQAELYVDLMSHDIGNMDQAMLGYLEMAMETLRPEGADKELLTQPLEIIKNSTRLINNVRKLRQLQSGEIPTRKVDIGMVLSEVVADVSRVPGRNVHIDYSPVSGCIVEANDLIKDLFSNLIGNAIRHSSGDLHISLVLRKVPFGRGEGYQVAVEDDGPGLSDQLKEKLQSVASGNIGKAERRGTGLLLVKALLEKFHGTLSIEDRVPGDFRKGSRFIVVLPVAK